MNIRMLAGLAPALVLVLGVAAVVVVPRLRWRRWRYDIRDDEIDLRRFEALAHRGKEALRADDASSAGRLLAEAAALEGASRWTFFRRVQFPLLMPTTLFVLINALINAVRLVDHLFVMTRGGPDNATELLLFYIYEVAFRFWDTAYGATLTIVLLLILAGLALGQFLYFDRRVHYR